LRRRRAAHPRRAARNHATLPFSRPAISRLSRLAIPQAYAISAFDGVDFHVCSGPTKESS
jgi:hypothetical protein